MNIIALIDPTYTYLCKVYGITGSDFVKAKDIPSENNRGHNIKSLIKHGLLLEYVEPTKHPGVVDNKSYKWNGGQPQFSLAYDYYYACRGKDKTYEDLLEIIKNPENYSADEILEAVSVKGIQEQNMGIEFKSEPYLLNTICRTYEEEKPTKQGVLIPSAETPLAEPLQLDIKALYKALDPCISAIIDKKFEGFFSDYVIIKQLMREMVDATIESCEKTKNSQNSIGAAIAILKTTQDNLFDISATMYHLLREQYTQLVEKCKAYPENEDYIKRKENISTAMQFMRQRVDSNIAITNKYGNGKK